MSKVNCRKILFDNFSIVAFSISLRVWRPDFFTIYRISSNEGIDIIVPKLLAVVKTGLAPFLAAPNFLNMLEPSVFSSIYFNAFLKKNS